MSSYSKIKQSKVITFNKILSDLLAQMSPIIGSTYHKNFAWLIGMNVILPINSFLDYALPHKDMILNKDDKFFNQNELPPNLSELDETFVNEIIQLKNIYYKLDEDSKENMWGIFQSLLILSIEYKDLC